ADPIRVDLRPRREVPDRVAEVGELAGRVLVLARLALAVAEVAMVEGERDEALGGEAAGVRADHLVLHAAQRPGERQCREPLVTSLRAPLRNPAVACDPQAVARERNPLRVHYPATPSCCMSPAMSLSNHVARIFPSPIRRIAISVHWTSLPVGGMPKKSPPCVPPCVMRAPTRSSSAAIRSMLTQ